MYVCCSCDWCGIAVRATDTCPATLRAVQVTKIIKSPCLSDRTPVSEATARISIFDISALQRKLSTNLNCGFTCPI